MRILRPVLPFVLALLTATCAGTGPLRALRDGQDVSAVRQVRRVHALLINGGGNKRINYQSHLLHIQQMRELLLDSGVAAERITIFSSDGEDPEVDLALRSLQPEESFWRLLGTSANARLRMPLVYVTSQIDGTTLRPATQEALSAWFETSARKIKAGDTLLVYVTDHGDKNKKDLTDNTITMWGKGEDVSVNELRRLLANVNPDVRVVMVMSQCFSGSFANLIDEQSGAGVDAGNPSHPQTCGYFSATPERRAYGCYAVNRGRENVGHSFRFIHALAGTGSLLDAHLDTLVTDATPDVPNRSSDFYLDQLLLQAAEQQGVEREALVDSLLEDAWQDRAVWEPEIRLLDRIGKAFGYFSPRSLAELEEQRTRLPDISGQMTNVSRAWQQTLFDANSANFERFLEAEPGWKTNLATVTSGRPGRLDSPAPPEIRMMTRTLLEDLASFTGENRDVENRIETLHTRGEDAAATSYRMEVRLAIVLRMRSVLTNVAGRQYLSTRGTPEQNARYASLLECEALRIPPVPSIAGTLDTPEPFPKFKADVERATAALPAWMGIRFREVQEPTRDRLGLDAGAARVLTIFPGSPSEKAGLQVTDIVTGPPGRPFNEARRIRSWTMLSPIGEPRELEVLRENRPIRVTLVPAPYPMKWPKLPGPPEIGSTAPPIEFSSYRGDESVTSEGGPYLLFFWATWCGPCKAAIPELLDFEASGVAPVIAITDEPAETLDKFFASDRDFPSIVAIDPYRQAFQTYGVSGTPTFVLVDGEGRINTYFSGYSKQKGLGAAINAMMVKGEGVEQPEPAEPVQ